MFSSHHRSPEIEIMDDLNCHGNVVDQTLRELDFINQWLGGNTVTLQPLKEIVKASSPDQPLTIVDLGCGSGEMLKLIAKQKSFEKYSLNLIGIDANPNIIVFAKQHTSDTAGITVTTSNIFSAEFKSQSFDIVLATLFLHHFSEKELVSLLKILKGNTRKAIIINDLNRHPLAYYSIKVLTSLFSRSAMVRYDAPLSVARGFRKNELITILEKAGISNYRLSWRWAFRWQLVINLSQ